MKLIMENWEEFLNEDYSKIDSMIDRLGDNTVSIESVEGSISVLFTDANGGIAQGGKVNGMLTIHPVKPDEYKPPQPRDAGSDLAGGGVTGCNGSWVVSYALAEKGFGPLLYDVAIEITSGTTSLNKGGYKGLTPDRTNLSRDAFGVWRKYLELRPDVQKVQLDDTENTLTPGDEDNCDPDSATVYPPFRSILSLKTDKDKEDYNQEFAQNLRNSAVMQVYMKPSRQSPALNKLIRLGKLFINGKKVG